MSTILLNTVVKIQTQKNYNTLKFVISNRI